MFNGWKTIIGLAIAAVPSLAALLGFNVSPDFETQALGTVDEVVTIGGLVLALYGRLVAQVPGWFAPKE